MKKNKWFGNPLNWDSPEFLRIQDEKKKELGDMKCLPEWSDKKLSDYQETVRKFD